MILLITGASHTGKTLLAQKLLEKYKYPYLSIDLLKMGLIRSKNTNLTPEEDGELETYLWPIVREIVKTAVENRQNLIVEGAYIPPKWEKGFPESYLKEIHYYCLVMSEKYIKQHFSQIQDYACEIEQRLDDTGCTMEFLLEENGRYLEMCQKYGYPFLWIDDGYPEMFDI